MTILQSLKKLHKKMTGQDTNSKTIGGILDSMQENYNGGSGSDGDDTYETLTFTIEALEDAEIPEGIQMYSLVEKSDNLALDNFEIYFNSLDYPLIKQELKSESQYHYCYNMNIESLEVTPPVYDLMVMEDEDDLFFLTTEQFEPGDKITILKKVSGGGGQGSNFAFIVEVDGYYNIDIELEDIYNAALAGKQVYLKHYDSYYTLIDFGIYHFTFINFGERSITIYRLDNSKKVQQSTFILENNEEPN